MKPVSKFDRYRKRWQKFISYHKSLGEDGQNKLATYGEGATKYWTVSRIFFAGLLSAIVIGFSLLSRKTKGMDIVLDSKLALLAIILFNTIYLALWFFQISEMISRK